MMTDNGRNKQVDSEVISEGDFLPTGKKVILGLQHTFTMFGATVLVPIITGMNVSVALFMAGIGTLFFHIVTKKKAPVFLGSSFAFIPPILAAAAAVAARNGVAYQAGDAYAEGLAYAQGGIVIAGLVYVVMSGLVYLFGYEKIVSFFPPIVTGPIIMTIGLLLAPTAIDMASGNWFLAIVALITVTLVSIVGKGFIKVLPVLIGLFVGYIVAMITANVDYTPFAEAGWFGIPPFQAARFDMEMIMIVAPVAIVTMVEHIGDVLAVGATVEKDLIKDPGLSRTLIGDGVATCISAMFGGPANTTYSENTGVLALTKVHNPVVMRIAACFAIVLAVIPKLGAFISTIPTAVVGGISIILFGMIAGIGVRTIVENQVDFKKSRNLIIAAVILVLGLGGATLSFKWITVSGMALGAIAGIILNKILPDLE
ncbi:MAG: solute carrier family 23 protein [Firmicutes bacterium]|nr:solute carrier family 23 protein [Bacillota bacterium]MDD3850412.1 solute carrier family 23 protein [Bacillota bacterium]MDD4706607.1 solute carrier family 23 protein [Bacillota bacterium]